MLSDSNGIPLCPPSTTIDVEDHHRAEERPYNIVEQVFYSQLSLSATKKGPPPIYREFSGIPSTADAYLRLVAALPEGNRLVTVVSYKNAFVAQYLWDTGVASISAGSRDIDILITTTEDFYSDFVEVWKAVTTPAEHKNNNGTVSILVQDRDGVSARSLGYASVPFEESNYAKAAIPSIRKALKELGSPFPEGRLTIVEGPPGGGKTFLLRSFVHELPKVSFVFIPPAMVPSLGDPSLVSALLDLHEDNRQSSSPIVLICEDADSILTSRGIDNMPAVSSLLNVTSGLLGDTMDIRVIATTNAPKNKIDSAVMRPGRLSSYIQIPSLTNGHAHKVLSRLLEKETSVATWSDKEKGQQDTGSMGFNSSSSSTQGTVTLAQVYKTAREMGWDASSATTYAHNTVLLTLPDDSCYDGARSVLETQANASTHFSQRSIGARLLDNITNSRILRSRG